MWLGKSDFRLCPTFCAQLSSAKQLDRFESVVATAKASASKNVSQARDLGEKTIEQLMGIGRRSALFYQSTERGLDEVGAITGSMFHRELLWRIAAVVTF